ncbi:hypothetical protein SUGI_0079320 [Cryptomeria japonica]|nr:hypothetical protein SUGI_0079320 [Cryptomeria japonica]
MCVFVGFLLPRMASPSTGTKWSNILALLISISTHISTEVYVIHNAKDVGPLEKEREWWFVGSGGVLLLAFTGLMVLLGYVVIAGKFISETLSRKIKQSLSENKLENGDIEKDFEFKILKTWWVTRVSQPEYVIARSTFGAATGGTVTCCVVLFALKVILLRSLVKSVPLFYLQCVFILIGWTFIFNRWLTSVLYFRDLKSFSQNCTHVFLAGISRCFLLQRIVFGYTVYDLMGMNSAVWRKLKECHWYSKIKGHLKSICFVLKVLISPFLVIPWVALYFTAAAVTILMSMFFWGLLALLCGKIVGKVWKSRLTDEDLKKYENVLESVVIYGEDPESLLIANSRSFKNTKNSMGRALQKGKGCTELINLMRSNDSEVNFSDKLEHFVDERSEFKDMLKYFPAVKERTWRMTALALVKMITEVGDLVSPDAEQNNDIVHEAVCAYKQARNLMEFADFPENVDVNAESFSTSNMEDFLLRYQAERDYKALKKGCRHCRRIKGDDHSVFDKCRPKLVECSACIKDPFKQSLYSRNLALNSKDPCQTIYSATLEHFERLNTQASFGYACWEDVAPTYSLLQVSKFMMEQEMKDSQILMDTLHSFLASVVCQSLSDLPKKVLLFDTFVLDDKKVRKKKGSCVV